ncbi:MAG: hypothetical protein QOI08_189 [Actinomycetota bacterium]|nr:hypothetical protein [Actinomycetota bacterium]
MVRGGVVGGALVGGDVVGGVVVGGALVVVGTVVVVVAWVVDVLEVDVLGVEVLEVVVTGTVEAGVFDEFTIAPATPAINATRSTGTAIFAHRGHDRTHASGVKGSEAGGPAAGTVGSICVAGPGTTGTGSVGSALSGGYHLPSEACHQPGSSGS